ncbi:hypothetical protein ACFSYG_07015 [Leeuwenhoekiella polynyae]|uniref:Uncharacterized protein n=1 Tax=Leeuwenhoekiella polynyae TaxID=1550906 RepID=A0A4Q0NNR9_9FLAO|nr:hypothetical protein [Leeuwenhoekiella polynyae]RXG11206.1 hypothetical protein DSM02_4136 [Leeuwenhoekiella polynyae]
MPILNRGIVVRSTLRVWIRMLFILVAFFYRLQSIRTSVPAYHEVLVKFAGSGT